LLEHWKLKSNVLRSPMPPREFDRGRPDSCSRSADPRLENVTVGIDHVARVGHSPISSTNINRCLTRSDLGSIGKLPVALRSDGVTVLAISRVSAAVAHDPRLLFAFYVAVDARHPGADFIHQLTLAEG
jgi:hypothetical protein